MKAEQRIGKALARVRYFPAKENGRVPDRLMVEVNNPAGMNSFATVCDPTEDTLSLFFGAAESGFLAPLIDWLQERTPGGHAADVLAEMASVVAG